MTESERLEGHYQIREFIDPKISRTYYFETVLPKIRRVLLTKTYSKTNQTKVYTYKRLLLARLLEIEKI